MQEETFRGFCFSDRKIPYIFINSTKQNYRVRTFTLIHELAHIAIGSSGIVDPFNNRNAIESLCNKVAAQFLMPHDLFRDIASSNESKEITEWIDRIFQHVPLSKFAIAIRLSEVFEDRRLLQSWMKKMGPFRLGNFNFKKFDTEFDVSDQEAIELGQLDDSYSDDQEGEVDKFQPRHTPASYQVARLGFAVWSSADAALRKNLVSKYDVADHFFLRPGVVEKAIDSFRRKKAEVDKYVEPA